MAKKMYVYKRNKKSRIPLSAWLSYLMIATYLITSVTLAKYTTSTSANHEARVAKFEVSAAPAAGQRETLAINTVFGTTDEYEFQVANSSEVVVKYKITITNVPNDVQIKLDEGDFIKSPQGGGTVTDDEYRILDIGASVSHTLTFKSITQYTPADTYDDIKVEVKFDQVD